MSWILTGLVIAVSCVFVIVFLVYLLLALNGWKEKRNARESGRFNTIYRESQNLVNFEEGFDDFDTDDDYEEEDEDYDFITSPSKSTYSSNTSVSSYSSDTSSYSMGGVGGYSDGGDSGGGDSGGGD